MTALTGRLVQRAAVATAGAGRVLPPAASTTGPRPTVSVVVPCYNYGHYLRRCVGSVLDQDGVDVDVLVIDDASPDGSGRVALALAEADERVRAVVHTVNRRHIATYNEGLAQARGEFVVLLSADDVLAPGSLARATSLMRSHPTVGLVYGRAPEFAEDPPVRSRQGATSWTVWRGRDWLERRCRTGHNPVRCPEAVMRTSVLEQVGPYRADLPHGADFAMWMSAAAVSDVGYVAGVPQAYYRVHAANMSRTTFALGSPAGIVPDMREKRRCFEAVLTGTTAPAGAEDLLRTARRTLAEHALRSAVRAHVWGVARDWPVADLRDFALETHPGAASLSLWHALERRRRRGPDRSRRHPLFLPREASDRAGDAVTRWRERVGG